MKTYYQTHKEERKQYQREYIKKNRLKVKLTQKKNHARWYQNNKKSQNEYIKKYLKENRDKNNVIQTRKKLTSLLGHKCVKCGFTDKRALQIDFKNGGHSKLVKKLGGTWYVYKYYLNNPDKAKKDLQLLCANCNWIKRYTHNELIN